MDASAHQMFAQTAAVHPGTPNNDRLPLSQRADRQVVGFSTDKILQRIAAVGASQPVRMLAPFQQRFLDFGKGAPCQKHAQPEVVIFSPAVLLVPAEASHDLLAKGD